MVLSLFKFIPFPWRETLLYTRQLKVQIGKSTLIILFTKKKLPTLVGNKHLSVHIYLHRPRLFHLSTGNVRVRPVRNGHQSGYYRADTINIKKKQKIKQVFHRRTLIKKHRK